jgi:hypothetical protein
MIREYDERKNYFDILGKLFSTYGVNRLFLNNIIKLSNIKIAGINNKDESIKGLHIRVEIIKTVLISR